MKKLLSYVLVLALIISAVPMCFAEETTAIDPFVIFKEVKEPTNEDLKELIGEFAFNPGLNVSYADYCSFTLRLPGSDVIPRVPIELLSDEELVEMFKEKINIKPEYVTKEHGIMYLLAAENQSAETKGNYMRFRFAFSEEMQAAIHKMSGEDVMRFYYNYFESFKDEEKMIFTNRDFERIIPNACHYTAIRVDLDFDGEATIKDLKLFKQILLGKECLYNLRCADFDGDGEVSLVDFKAIKKAVLEGEDYSRYFVK